MEEYRSSEALEREIHEDAVKQVLKIRRDGELAAQEAEAIERRRGQEERDEMKRRHKNEIVLHREESEARLPLERKRIRISYAEGLLAKHLEQALADYDETKLKNCMIDRLSRDIRDLGPSFCAGGGSALVWGFTEKDMAQDLNNALGVAIQATRDKGERAGRGFVIEWVDRGQRFELSDSMLTEELLDTHRGELARALFGDLGGSEW